ncbi:DUF4145 domain-containing protein [Paenibacillus sp. SN-8-1]|uniref:DUF4145 domain-containing protein n=1 Tax=Paenibacillus sp. SN-8-1 TaxID=3435409 RepID=UPI003D9A2279
MSDKVLHCSHCGNKTLMKLVAEHELNDQDHIYERWSADPVHSFYWFSHWKLYLCPVCKNVSLIRLSGDSEDIGPRGEPIITETTLYPPYSIENKYIPTPVGTAFEAALKVRHLEGAVCVLALRRALEKLCKHEGAEGKDLFNKLKNLQDKGKLPPIMDDIAFILRIEGNSAAHADDVEFDTNTVNQLIDFTQTILDYMYTLPNKIKAAQTRIAEIAERDRELKSGAISGAAE